MFLSKRPYLHVFLSVYILLNSAIGLSWAPLFGPEFEFSNEILDSIHDYTGSEGLKVENEWATKLKDEVEKRCAGIGCKVTEIKGDLKKKWDVEFSSGYKFRISVDPKVVEVGAMPLTTDDQRLQKKLMEYLLFDSAKSVGLKPSKKNSGHINIGLTSAFKNPELFLKFYVDYSNHPELALGILGGDLSNSPPVAVLKSEQREELFKIINEFYSSKKNDLQSTAVAIQRRVQKYSYENSLFNSRNGYYHAISLKTIAGIKIDYYTTFLPTSEETQRVEIRAIYGQESYEQFILLSELFKNRILFLGSQKGPAIYINWQRTSYDPQMKVNLFWVYLSEMGLDYEKFKVLLPHTLQDIEPNIVFQKDLSALDWSSSKLRQELGFWIEESLKSDWIRKKMIEILSHPNSQIFELRYDLLSRLANEHENLKLKNSNAKYMISDFVAQILNRTTDLEVRRQLITHFSSKKYKIDFLNRYVKNKFFENLNFGFCQKLLLSH